MSSNNLGFNSSSNNLNQINQSSNSLNNNNNNNNNNNLNIINLLPQRRVPLIEVNPQLSNNSSSNNRLFNNQINNLNQRYNNNNNLLLRYFNSNNSNINNNQEENNNEPINEVSPMEVDNQILYTRYETEEEEIKEKIQSVINLLEMQFNKPEYEIDFQLIYSKCYDICLHWKSNELFQEVEKLLKNIVLNFLEEIKKLNDEEPNYNFMNRFVSKFQFFSKKNKQMSDALSYMDKIYRQNLVATGGINNSMKDEDSISLKNIYLLIYHIFLFLYSVIRPSSTFNPHALYGSQ